MLEGLEATRRRKLRVIAKQAGYRVGGATSNSKRTLQKWVDAELAKAR